MTDPEQLDPTELQGPQNRVQRSVSVEPADPKTGITLDEMAAFAQDAMRADIDGATPIKITLGFRSQIRMTLDEMAALVQDAMRADIDGATPIKITVGFRSQVRTAKIEEER